jgi:hypothetical protein
MRTVAKTAFALLSISLLAAGFDKEMFQPGPPENYAHQSSDKVAVGAKQFDSYDLTKTAFGKKADFNRYGVLPVLLVIKNGRDETVDLEDLQVKLAAGNGRSVPSIDPAEAASAGEPKRPQVARPRISLGHKSPLNVPEVYTRAFTARMLPAGEQASGFFYFQAHAQPGLRLYVSGLVERPSGKEMIYFEIPLDRE